MKNKLYLILIPLSFFVISSLTVMAFATAQAESNQVISEEQYSFEGKDGTDLHNKTINIKFSFVNGSGYVCSYTDKNTIDPDKGITLEDVDQAIFTINNDITQFSIKSVTQSDATLRFMCLPDCEYYLLYWTINGTDYNTPTSIEIDQSTTIKMVLGTVDAFSINGHNANMSAGLQYSAQYQANDGSILDISMDDQGYFELNNLNKNQATGTIIMKVEGVSDLTLFITFNLYDKHDNRAVAYLGDIWAASLDSVTINLTGSDNHVGFNYESKRADSRFFRIFLCGNYFVDRLLGAPIEPIMFDISIKDNGEIYLFMDIDDPVAGQFRKQYINITPYCNEGYEFDFWTINGRKYTAGQKVVLGENEILKGSINYKKIEEPPIPSPDNPENITGSLASQTGDLIPWKLIIMLCIVIVFGFAWLIINKYNLLSNKK